MPQTPPDHTHRYDPDFPFSTRDRWIHFFFVASLYLIFLLATGVLHPLMQRGVQEWTGVQIQWEQTRIGFPAQVILRDVTVRTKNINPSSDPPINIHNLHISPGIRPFYPEISSVYLRGGSLDLSRLTSSEEGPSTESGEPSFSALPDILVENIQLTTPVGNRKYTISEGSFLAVLDSRNRELRATLTPRNRARNLQFQAFIQEGTSMSGTFSLHAPFHSLPSGERIAPVLPTASSFSMEGGFELSQARLSIRMSGKADPIGSRNSPPATLSGSGYYDRMKEQGMVEQLDVSFTYLPEETTLQIQSLHSFALSPEGLQENPLSLSINGPQGTFTGNIGGHRNPNRTIIHWNPLQENTNLGRTTLFSEGNRKIIGNVQSLTAHIPSSPATDPITGEIQMGEVSFQTPGSVQPVQITQSVNWLLNLSGGFLRIGPHTIREPEGRFDEITLGLQIPFTTGRPEITDLRMENVHIPAFVNPLWGQHLIASGTVSGRKRELKDPNEMTSSLEPSSPFQDLFSGSNQPTVFAVNISQLKLAGDAESNGFKADSLEGQIGFTEGGPDQTFSMAGDMKIRNGSIPAGPYRLDVATDGGPSSLSFLFQHLDADAPEGTFHGNFSGATFANIRTGRHRKMSHLETTGTFKKSSGGYQLETQLMPEPGKELDTVVQETYSPLSDSDQPGAEDRNKPHLQVHLDLNPDRFSGTFRASSLEGWIPALIPDDSLYHDYQIEQVSILEGQGSFSFPVQGNQPGQLEFDAGLKTSHLEARQGSIVGMNLDNRVQLNGSWTADSLDIQIDGTGEGDILAGMELAEGGPVDYSARIQQGPNQPDAPVTSFSLHGPGNSSFSLSTSSAENHGDVVTRMEFNDFPLLFPYAVLVECLSKENRTTFRSFTPDLHVNGMFQHRQSSEEWNVTGSDLNITGSLKAFDSMALQNLSISGNISTGPGEPSSTTEQLQVTASEIQAGSLTGSKIQGTLETTGGSLFSFPRLRMQHGGGQISLEDVQVRQVYSGSPFLEGYLDMEEMTPEVFRNDDAPLSINGYYRVSLRKDGGSLNGYSSLDIGQSGQIRINEPIQIKNLMDSPTLHVSSFEIDRVNLSAISYFLKGFGTVEGLLTGGGRNVRYRFGEGLQQMELWFHTIPAEDVSQRISPTALLSIQKVTTGVAGQVENMIRREFWTYNHLGLYTRLEGNNLLLRGRYQGVPGGTFQPGVKYDLIPLDMLRNNKMAAGEEYFLVGGPFGGVSIINATPGTPTSLQNIINRIRDVIEGF